jgi:signal transduction histidine kinase
MAALSFMPRLRLGTRIAATLLVALLAVQALNAAAFFLLPRPEISVHSARWLIGKIEETASAIFAASGAERQALASQADAQNDLRIHWRNDAFEPHRHTPHSHVLDRVEATLERDLAGKVHAVIVQDRGGPPGPGPHRNERRPPSGFDKSGPIGADEADVFIFGDFEIALQGLDGGWLLFEPEWRPGFAYFLRPWFVSLVGAVVLVSAISALMTRRFVHRLDRLVEAAQKMGLSRETTPIEPAGLDEFGVIASALNEMQARIKQFIDDRTQMLAAISHDLRTSLTRLRLEAEELPESATKNQLIADMIEMERMISATLTFAGDDLKNEPQSRVDLGALLISLCDSYFDCGMLAEYTGPNHAHIHCQPVAMKRAFDNLIGNAIKYGLRARVGLSVESGSVAVSVCDDGPGIPLDQVELAFRPFRRLEQSRNRESGGVGLGLTIARDIIRSHGGEILLQNRPEGGLEALVRLPMRVAA